MFNNNLILLVIPVVLAIALWAAYLLLERK